MSADSPPPHVAAAAVIINDWLKGQPSVVPTQQQSAAPKLTDAEKLDRARQHDQTKMPPWKDPRGA